MPSDDPLAIAIAQQKEADAQYALYEKYGLIVLGVGSVLGLWCMRKLIREEIRYQMHQLKKKLR